MKRTWGEETCYVVINFSAKQEKTVALTLKNPVIAGQVNVSPAAGSISNIQDGPVLNIPPYGIVVLWEN